MTVLQDSPNWPTWAPHKRSLMAAMTVEMGSMIPGAELLQTTTIISLGMQVRLSLVDQTLSLHAKSLVLYHRVTFTFSWVGTVWSLKLFELPSIIANVTLWCKFYTRFDKRSPQVGRHHSQPLPLFADWTNFYWSGSSVFRGRPGVVL